MLVLFVRGNKIRKENYEFTKQNRTWSNQRGGRAQLPVSDMKGRERIMSEGKER